MSASSTITVDDKQIDLPVKTGTIGPNVIDIGKLHAKTGVFTFDPRLYLDGLLRIQDHLYRR